MCGLCGQVRFSGTPRFDDGDLLDRMTDSLAHRGPSDRGTWSDEYAMVGSRRLAVIDLSRAGRQPMSSEDGRVHIVYNGEVYNYRELKRRYRLADKGHRFTSRTDTEVLLHLYEELGTAMFAELNGMFSVAIWDAGRRQLVLGRDRYGIKPLFYQRDQYRFRFGSEIKAILADPRVTRTPCLQALHDFLTFDYIPGAQTAFEGIHEVPPAHFMTVDVTGPTHLERYWDLSFEVDPSMSEELAVARSRELMERAVERRLIADVPIGILLSGGMDSSALLAFMAQRETGAIHTYSVGFEEPSFNELPYARIMSRRHETVHREVVVTPSIVRDLLPRYLGFIDEPYADGSAIPTYCVCELAANEVVVVLSGEGGDEAFVGYETYAAHKASRWFGRIPAVLRNGLIAPVVNALPVSHRKLSLEFRLKRFLGGQDLRPEEAHLWWRVVLSEAQKLELYGPRVLESLEAQASVRHFKDAYDRARASDNLNRLLYVDSAVFLPDDLMIKNDRMSMAHGLEARVPFTDHELTGFMASVPVGIKFPGLKKKHVMREALRAMLPPEILRKKKVGLELPYSRWFRHELREDVEHHLGADRVESTGLFRSGAIQHLLDDHMNGRVDNGRALWGLLNYMVWLDLYFDSYSV